MKTLLNTLADAMHDNGAPARDACAVFAALAAYLLAFGAAWELLLPRIGTTAALVGMFAAIVPALVTWAAIIIITERH